MAEVYVITCLENGKKYIGLTRYGYMKRFAQHFRAAFEEESSVLLHKAMRKYGLKNFSIECVYESDNVVMCGIMEQYLIETLETLVPYGYNCTKGGETAIPEDYRRLMKENQERKKEKEFRICKGCGKEFEVKRWWQKFCKIRCRNTYHNNETSLKKREYEDQEKEAGN